MTSYRIMLIDDDESMQTLVKRILEDAGYEYIGIRSGQKGIEAIAEIHPDLLLLDVMMPGMNGFNVCTELRNQGRRIPIIFLTAKGDIVDMSSGFKAGADDYMVKPFSSEELLLRIEAHLRRHKSELAFAKAVDRPGSLKMGDLEIIFQRYEVRLRGELVDLTAKEFEILALIASNPGQVFSRQQIYEHIWGRDSEVDQNSITVFIRKIREKIEDNPSQPKYLLTVWRVGYKFAERI